MNSLGAARAQFLATVRLPDRLIHGMGTRLALIASLSLAAILLSAAWAVSAASPALGDRVLEFCKKHRGEQVGNGECAGLATQALKAAGAKTRGGPDAPKPGDYVWGRQVLLVEASPEAPKLTGKVTDVLPGDIVQFHDTKFVTAHFPHHTAVVKEMADQHLTVYQQHVGGTKIVREGAVRIAKLAEGGCAFIGRSPKSKRPNPQGLPGLSSRSECRPRRFQSGKNYAPFFSSYSMAACRAWRAAFTSLIA